MKLHLWGTDFRRSHTDFRNRLFLSQDSKEKVLRELLNLGFQDLIYLNTCNRVEFYTTAHDYFTDTRHLWENALAVLGLSREDYFQGYHYEGKGALRHLLRVACSLESLVIGESQILGQLKEALHWNKKNNLPLDPSMERCFQLAFETAKWVRTSTTIAQRPVSVATLGLERVETWEAEIPIEKVVVVGRSPISVWVVQALLKQHPGVPITWVNRSVKNLHQYEESKQVQLTALKDFQEKPMDFSHLFTSTSSVEPLFNDAFFEKVKPIDRERVVIDFAQPQDVDISLPPFRTYALRHITMDDLKGEADKNASERARASLEAEAVIEDALKQFYLAQKQTPILRDFNHLEPILLKDIEHLVTQFSAKFPDDIRDRLKEFADKVTKRNLHSCREHLKEMLNKVSEPGQDAEGIEAKTLFG